MFSFGVNDAQAAKKALPPSSNSIMDEEAQKRNTDCIYFLASPLTCKKGANCEYRHSEPARMNPRDCYYWKAGNCLNPRCCFRHLPLDGKPASATSVASTSSTPIMPQLVPATFSSNKSQVPAPILLQLVPATSASNKSQTPCYFFSQGYCTKNDKCPFMHGSPAESYADAATQKHLAVGVNGKAVHSSGRPLIALKENALTDRSAATNGFLTSSKVPVISQEMPQIAGWLGKSKSAESNGAFAPLRHYHESRKPMGHDGRLYDVEESQLGGEREQGLQDVIDSQGMFVQEAADFRYPSNHRQVDASWEDCPSSGSGLEHQITKSLSNSTASNRQDSLEQSRSEESEDFPEENWEPRAGRSYGLVQLSLRHLEDSKVAYQGEARNGKLGLKEQSPNERRYIYLKEQSPDVSADLRNHLMKRRKKSSFHAVSQKLEIRGQPDVSTCGRGSQKPTIQQEGKLLARADISEVKASKFDARENSILLQRGTLNKVCNTEKSSLPSGGTAKRETLTFTGPKSLAQIKAERMAGRESASKVIGKQTSSTTTIEAGEKVTGTNKLVIPAEIMDVAVSNCKLSSSPVSTSSTITNSVHTKQKTATSTEFEGPKPLTLLLKRKRELDSDGNARDTVPGPLKVEVSVRDSYRELEDGEVGDDIKECKEESLPSTSCPLIFLKEDSQVMSPSSGEALQRRVEEAAELDAESTEDELKSDAEMEDMACGDAGCGIDDEDDDDDDDDDDDFAKKLGRIFALSSD